MTTDVFPQGPKADQLMCFAAKIQQQDCSMDATHAVLCVKSKHVQPSHDFVCPTKLLSRLAFVPQEIPKASKMAQVVLNRLLHGYVSCHDVLGVNATPGI